MHTVMLTLNSNDAAYQPAPLTLIMSCPDRLFITALIGNAVMQYAREHALQIPDVGFTQQWSVTK